MTFLLYQTLSFYCSHIFSSTVAGGFSMENGKSKHVSTQAILQKTRPRYKGTRLIFEKVTVVFHLFISQACSCASFLFLLLFPFLVVTGAQEYHMGCRIPSGVASRPSSQQRRTGMSLVFLFSSFYLYKGLLYAWHRQEQKKSRARQISVLLCPILHFSSSAPLLSFWFL